MDATDPTHLFAARKGSPVTIGLGVDEVFIASESSAFANYTNEYVNLN